MHLHSFTYDFHVRVLTDRLTKLVQKQKTSKRKNHAQKWSMFLEHRNSLQNSVNKSASKSKKNAIAEFLDDFLKYYNQPPLYSDCLVLSGIPFFFFISSTVWKNSTSIGLQVLSNVPKYPSPASNCTSICWKTVRKTVMVWPS